VFFSDDSEPLKPVEFRNLMTECRPRSVHLTRGWLRNGLFEDAQRPPRPRFGS